MPGEIASWPSRLPRMAVAHLPADGEDAWQEPAYLDSLLPRASTITFGDGQHQRVNLRLDGQ